MQASAIWWMLATMMVAAGGLGGCASNTVPRADHPALAGEMPERLKGVREQLPDETSAFALIVRFRVKPERMAEFEPLAASATEGTRREAGNRAYTFHYGMKDATDVVLYERWRSFRDLRLHFAAEHMQPFFAQVPEFLSAPPELKVYRN